MKIVKERSILMLLDRLALEERGWCIRDDWEADLCAIGISNSPTSRRRAYVSTFKMKRGRYYCECEKGDMRRVLGYETLYKEDDLTFDELVSVLEQYLR